MLLLEELGRKQRKVAQKSEAQSLSGSLTICQRLRRVTRDFRLQKGENNREVLLTIPLGQWTSVRTGRLPRSRVIR